MATPPPPPVPKNEADEDKQFSFVTMILIVVTVVGLLAITVMGILSLKRKYMGVEERINVVNSIINQHDEMYARLSNYEALEYTQKFAEYLEFIDDNVIQTRTDMKVIFSKNPKMKFKANSQILIGGRNKKEFLRNIKKKLYRMADYKMFLDEARGYLDSRKVYKFKPHHKLGRKFSSNPAIVTKAEEFGKAQKDFSSAESDYKNFTKRYKEKKKLMKKLKKDYAAWKADPTAPPLPEVNPETGEKNPKPIVSPEGKTEDQVKAEYKEIRNKLKLEIQELKNMRQHAYQKYKVNKAKFKAVDKAEEE